MWRTMWHGRWTHLILTFLIKKGVLLKSKVIFFDLIDDCSLDAFYSIKREKSGFEICVLTLWFSGTRLELQLNYILGFFGLSIWIVAAAVLSFSSSFSSFGNSRISDSITSILNFSFEYVSFRCSLMCICARLSCSKWPTSPKNGSVIKNIATNKNPEPIWPQSMGLERLYSVVTTCRISLKITVQNSTVFTQSCSIHTQNPLIPLDYCFNLSLVLHMKSGMFLCFRITLAKICNILSPS